jgi:hypothetical protein
MKKEIKERDENKGENTKEKEKKQREEMKGIENETREGENKYENKRNKELKTPLILLYVDSIIV